MANSILVVLVTGKHTVDINGEPTRTEWFVLGLLVFVLPVAATVGWLVSRIRSVRNRTLVSFVSVGVAVVAGILGGPSPRIVTNLVFEGIVIAGALALTACGVGSILGWGLRTADGELRIRRRAVRARAARRAADRPGLLQHLCVVDGVDDQRRRLWLALLFLGLIAIAFITSATVERVRPMLAGARESSDDDVRLTGTPFEKMPHPPAVIRCRGPNGQTWCSCSPRRRCFRSGWWPSSPG